MNTKDYLKMIIFESPLISKMVNRAKEISREQHKDQTRRFTGEPYHVHPERVADIIATNKKSKKMKHLVSAAYLHDTIEDATMDYNKIKALFGALVASLVQELTSDDKKIKEIGKTEYLKNKMSNMSSYALVIKLADRLDNTQDLNNTSQKFKDKYIKETLSILDEIQKRRKLTRTQKKLVDMINNNIEKANK